MKKGFTMIELIFVIVILGILAAVAIPKLAATRDDARLAAVKTDIGTFMNAIPAWYQGQKDARIANAVSLDTKQWKRDSTAANEKYTLSIDGSTCVSIAVWDMNNSDYSNGTGKAQATVGTGATNDINSSNGHWVNVAAIPNGFPVFRVIKEGTPAGVCKTLWDDLGVVEQNITMAGNKVVW